MKITVTADDGSTAFEYDTTMGSNCLCPGLAERPPVLRVLAEATSFLDDSSTVTSIRGDISAVIGRIEHELGAHPAFTWAQTKLSNAASHLESYVAGKWEEPAQDLARRVTVDVRGIIKEIRD
ncbi:hypothetical protein SAMN05216337_1001149 [Bradyrhizobium brasilense]|uniref:Uncharacterized protein n=1 Tax=Bradyrhizobium brasilense TaxID=1419277 RepID=A0A1G6IHM1_9BRAD|nr:hypothetical protein [Bradyrhizobium brasilense]SDC05893.1 hypothetical protein SAMN05216337_1001149 [Bradyrhizobium brasilense]